MSDKEIPKYIIDNLQFLRLLARTKSERKLRKLLKNASTQQLLALVEICLNILAERFHLTTRQKNRLLPYANFVRQFSRLKTEKGARKFVVQKGTGAGTAFFAALVTPLLVELFKQSPL